MDLNSLDTNSQDTFTGESLESVVRWVQRLFDAIPNHPSPLSAFENYFCSLDNSGNSILMLAIHYKNINAFQCICQSKHFPIIKNQVNNNGGYALQLACLYQDINLINYLLSKSCKILLPGEYAGAPVSLLHQVIDLEVVGILALLLDDLTEDKYHPDETEYILSFRKDGQNASEYARSLGKNDMVNRIASTISINSFKKKSYTAQNLSEEILKLNESMERVYGGNLPESDPFNNLGCLVRADKGNVLLRYENLFLLLDNYGDTVLNHAIDADNENAVKEILTSPKYNTIVHRINSLGGYALEHAMWKRGIRMLNLLLFNDHRNQCRILLPKHEINGPRSVIHVAVKMNNECMLRLLLRDLSNRDKYSIQEVNYILNFKESTKDNGVVDVHTYASILGRKNLVDILDSFHYHPQ